MCASTSANLEVGQIPCCPQTARQALRFVDRRSENLRSVPATKSVTTRATSTSLLADRHDAGRGVNRDATNITAPGFRFVAMQTCSHGQADTLGFLAQG